MKSKLVFITAISALCLSSHTFGEANSLNEIEEIIVTATRWETVGVPTATSVSTITRDQIIESGAQNIIDVLKGQGGIQIQDLFGDGSRSIISMRGFGNNGGSNTLVLVDGRRLNNTDLKTPDLSFISLKDVERIEIIQGSASVLYCDQAVGGAINIITRKTDKLDFNGEFGFGSYDHKYQKLNVSNRLENGIGIRVSGEKRASDNYRNQNDLDYGNFFSNLSYEWDRGDIFVEYIHIDENLETPGAIFQQQIAVSRKLIGPFSAGDFNDTVSDTGRIGGSFSLTPNWEFAAEYTHRNEDIDGFISSTEFNQHRLVRAVNPRLRGNLPFGKQNVQLVAGADIENTEYKLISGVGDTINDQDMNAVYTLITWQINNQFSLIGGARYAELENDSFKRDPFAAFPLPIDTFVSKVNEDEQTADSFGILFTPTDEWRLFAKRETIFRFPLADELTGTVALFDDLETQTGESYEAGVEWHNNSIQTKLVGYKLDLEDEIAFDPLLNFGIGANINFDPTERIGAIFEINVTPIDELDIGVQYSYVDATFESGAFSGNRIPMVAEHQLHLNSIYRFWPNWSLYGEIFMISGRVAGGDLEDTFPNLPGYGIGNLNLRYDNGNFSFSAKVNNLLDKEYSSSAATGFSPFIPGPFGFGGTDTGFFPAPERNFLFALSYNYE
ncbi:MAG: TonB-dependent receptor [Gammaproteobacteria bacterium]